MLLTIGLIFVPVLFRKDSTSFALHECALTDNGEKIRTRFETRGITKWGSPVEISGVDHFWFAPESAKIVRHQSEWNQTPKQLRDAFLGQKA